MAMKNLRNPNVEVLRVMAMFMIVLYHAFSHGIYGYKFANLSDWWTVFFNDLTYWHVDAFVAISGWFGIRFSVKKFASLYGVILCYSIVGCIAWWLFDRATFGFKSIQVTGGWFGGSYLMLMLMAPLLNGAVERLRGHAKTLVAAWCLMAVGVTIHWAPKELFLAVHPTGAGGHSFFTLMYVYLTARIARVAFEGPIRKGVVVLLASTCFVGIAAMALLRLAHMGTLSYLAGFFASYQSPLVWGLSIALVMYFVWYAKCPVWMGRFCSFAAPSMFGIFLVHEVLHVGWKELLAIERMLDGRMHPAVVISLTAVVVFFVCLVIDLIRRICVYRIKDKVNPLLDRIDSLPVMKELGTL